MIQKARRATPASKPLCNTKGTTCTPPWKSTYPCPIPSILAKCSHPRLNSPPRPQVLYTEVCTQAFAILLPPHSLLIQTCRSFTSLCACMLYISCHSSSSFHSDEICPGTYWPLLQFFLICEVAFHATAILIHRAGPLPSAPHHGFVENKSNTSQT